MGLPAFLSLLQVDLSSRHEMIKLLTGQDLGAWAMKTPPQLSIMPAKKNKIIYKEFTIPWIIY
jgi:hypothetical protein